MPVPKRLIIMKHPPPQGSRFVGGLDFHVDQREPTFRRTTAGTGHRLKRRQFSDEVDRAAFAFEGIAHDFLVQPCDFGKVESLSPIWEEEPKELGEELLQQPLKARSCIASFPYPGVLLS